MDTTICGLNRITIIPNVTWLYGCTVTVTNDATGQTFTTNFGSTYETRIVKFLIPSTPNAGLKSKYTLSTTDSRGNVYTRSISLGFGDDIEIYLELSSDKTAGGNSTVGYINKPLKIPYIAKNDNGIITNMTNTSVSHPQIKYRYLKMVLDKSFQYYSSSVCRSLASSDYHLVDNITGETNLDSILKEKQVIFGEYVSDIEAIVCIKQRGYSYNFPIEKNKIKTDLNVYCCGTSDVATTLSVGATIGYYRFAYYDLFPT